MTHRVADLVEDTTISTGAGALTLAGAVNGRRAIADVPSIADNDTIDLTVILLVGATITEWQTARWQYDADAGTIAAVEVYDSSNGGSAVSFSVGLKYVVGSVSAAMLMSRNGNVFQETLITASGTFNLHADTKFIDVEVVGAGGGGGGANGAGGTAVSVGSGAHCGSIARKFAARPASGSATVVIGAAGSGVSADHGTAGGTSSWSDGTNTLSAAGGNGGLYGGNSDVIVAAVTGPSTATGGTENISGAGGNTGYGLGATALGSSVCACMSGGGGSGPHGAGGPPVPLRSTVSAATAGGAATGYGSGGSGAVAYGSGGVVAGGNGAPGLVIVREYR